MKTFLVLFISAFGIMATASPVVTSVKQFTYIDAPGMLLGGPEVTSTTINFEYTSCMAYYSSDFELSIFEDGLGQTRVSVELNRLARDCRGPVKKRSYKISTDDIDKSSHVIVQNPSKIKVNSAVSTLPTPAPAPICTAQACPPGMVKNQKCKCVLPSALFR